MVRRSNKAMNWAAVLVIGGALGVGATQANQQTTERPAIYVSSNGPTNAGDVTRYNANLQRGKTIDVGNNEGVELDRLGNLYQAGDVISGTGTLRIASQIRNRLNGTAFAPAQDREISGDQTTLIAPKGIAIAQTSGFVIVADNGVTAIKVFGSSAGGNVAPVAVNNLPAKPWDIAYDEPSDRLYVALVNGVVAVFDDYIGDGSAIGADGIARTLTPSNASGTQVSTNLHGIVYDRTRDMLVITDVGAATAAQSADFNRDGRIYVLEDASTTDGAVIPIRTLIGDATLMGNPVDMILDGTDVIVAEKANDRLLRFNNIFSGDSGNIAPDQSVADTKPESVVAEGAVASGADITDIENTAIAIESIVTTSNPPSANEFVSHISTALDDVQTTFNTTGGIPSIESVGFDQNGDGYITFDDGLMMNAEGGILVVNRLAKGRDAGTYNARRDRMISGDQTQLVSPKGLDIADDLGMVMIAENGPNASILVFSTQASGNVAPLFVTSDLGGRKPWDIDYDPTNNRLYVAATDGTMLVYDNYSDQRGADGPDRVITPTNAAGAKISVNLHGIIHVASSNLLLLSDVGSATDASDGQVFTIANADTADGNVAVRARISGPDTRLGNPVDITFDGAHLYIAEKSNNLVLRYDNIEARTGASTAAADQSFERNKPESIALIPEYLQRAPEQSVRIHLPLVFK